MMIKIKMLTALVATSLFTIIAMGQSVNNQNTRNTNAFDYSNLSWIEAFDSLHTCMSFRYPFTEWKAVDWQEKEAITRPLIVDAQNNSDKIAFIQYLFEYLYQIPDGHIELLGELDSFKQSKIAGSYGFNMIPIDDGTIVASFVPEESPAYVAGLRSGDKILKWNGTHIDSVGNKEYLNFFRNYATTEGRMFSRYLMQSRDSVNANTEIVYQSQHTKLESTITLSAFEDNMEMYLIGLFNTAQPPNMDSLVYYEMLENDIGYLYIGAETAGGITPEEIMQSPDFIKMQEAITYFSNNNIEKLIVDLRFNLGGNDLQAAITMGLFYEQPSFYEYITASYDYNYEVIYELWTEPLMPVFNGEIAVIVDPNCISTGEGLAMMLQRLDNAQVVSHWGTNASFGIVDYDPVLLPEGLAVSFPQGRSLNENYIIQIDSDANLVGGVMPDIKVPNNVDNIKKQWEQGVDVEMEYAKSLLLDFDEIIVNQKCLVYPNPCSGFLNIKLSSFYIADYNINIFNSHGQMVLFEQLCRNGNDQKFTLDLRKLVSGLYFYRISGGNNDLTGKIVIE